MGDGITSTSCAFIPVFCYYDRQNGGEIKTPVLISDQNNSTLKAIIVNVDPTIFTEDELKDQFIDAYYENTDRYCTGTKSLDSYDIYPKLITALHTDDEEISVYVCELYENTEPYFKSQPSIANLVSYKADIDVLISGGQLDPLTEKILIALSEKDYLTAKQNFSSIMLF